MGLRGVSWNIRGDSWNIRGVSWLCSCLRLFKYCAFVGFRGVSWRSVGFRGGFAGFFFDACSQYLKHIYYVLFCFSKIVDRRGSIDFFRFSQSANIFHYFLLNL